MSDWIPVKGYEEVYSINSKGQVKRNETEKILKSGLGKHGYLVVSLWKDNQGKTHHVHRLIAEHFLANPENLSVINHIDGDKTNNSITNLEWTTYSKNNQHAYDKGLKKVSENVINSVRERARVMNKNNNYRSIPVEAYDLEGNKLGDFISIKQASNHLGIGIRAIERCLKGRIKQPKKYVFKYKEAK